MTTDNQIGEVRTRVGKMWLREDGIVQSDILPGAAITLMDAKQGLVNFVQVSNGKRRPVLTDIGGIKTIERAARIELSKLEEALAVALLVDSAVSRIIGNVFVTINKTNSPIRLFTSEAAAVAWLKEYLE